MPDRPAAELRAGPNGGLDRKLGDAVSDGKLTARDADTVRAFAQFLTESGPPLKPGGPLPQSLDTPEKREAWRARWLPYMLGDADGPIEVPS